MKVKDLIIRELIKKEYEKELKGKLEIWISATLTCPSFGKETYSIPLGYYFSSKPAPLVLFNKHPSIDITATVKTEVESILQITLDSYLDVDEEIEFSALIIGEGVRVS